VIDVSEVRYDNFDGIDGSQPAAFNNCHFDNVTQPRRPLNPQSGTVRPIRRIVNE
jgi:hypothetical protein